MAASKTVNMETGNNFTAKIIVVDDEPLVSRAICQVLRRTGYEVTMILDPQKVLPLIDDPQIEVVLTDIFMPDLDGLEVCRQVKTKRPDIEVIVMTGMDSIDSAIDAMKAGAYDFLPKPFENSDIVTLTIAKALERRKLLERTKYLENQIELHHRSEEMIGSGAISSDVHYSEAKARAHAIFDVRYLENLLGRTGGVIAEAARLAGMDRSNFRRLLVRYKLNATMFRRD